MLGKRVRCGVALAVGMFVLEGCGGAPQVQSELPIRHVVVYRNGVAYFERAGHVEKDEVRFEMRQGEVGDFLATLAVMEQGGSSVRSAAFPLKGPPEEASPPGDGYFAEEGPRPKHDDRRKDMRTVVLTLDGRAHDLQVGYIAAAPVWHPSYRLVVQDGGQAAMQAWGIVENLSGEDWRDVQISLVAGAPLAFEARLGTPVVPDRPVITDQGEIIAAMPKGETSVAQDRDGDGIPDAEDKDKDSSERPKAPSEPAPAAAAPPAQDSFGDAHGRGGLGLTGGGVSPPRCR
jgi:hypothetical protein